MALAILNRVPSPVQHGKLPLNPILEKSSFQVYGKYSLTTEGPGVGLRTEIKEFLNFYRKAKEKAESGCPNKLATCH